MGRIGNRGDEMEAIRTSSDGRDSLDLRREYDGLFDGKRSVCTASKRGNGNSSRELHDYSYCDFQRDNAFRISNN